MRRAEREEHFFGTHLGQGLSVTEAAAATRQTTEGVRTAGALLDLARAYDITMPITEVMYALLHEKVTSSKPLRH
ncbi:NAD(P)H-dependent glycerol-3-phosphate dehydrogenase [Streptomyces celluloflavus]|uniref:NAD(P)H-dependent glycerol-3-phosphate dehydrogenase n=1 Tax=Streptomyces celluloflavus TaxID=58344 RepID=UPI0036DC4849